MNNIINFGFDENKENNEKEYEKYCESLKNAVNAVLYFESVKFNCEVFIKFVSNSEIKELNKNFRNKDNITDVLSFPEIEAETAQKLCGKNKLNKELKGEINPINNCIFLGDIIISVERAQEQADEIGQSLERELCFLCIHSVLHLLGYDHEISQKDDELMQEKQRNIINNMNFIKTKESNL